MPGQQLVFELRGNAQAHVHILPRVVDPAISRYQLYRKQWVAGTERGYQWRQHVTTEGGRRGNAQPPLGFTVGSSDGLFGQGQVALDVPDAFVILGAGGCQRHTAGGAAEQANLQVAFQACQVLADRGRAQAQVAGTGGDAAGFDHLDETANGVEQVHAEPLDS
ncbi:hypothetical protein D3C75_929490 [compost metagenome]